jgi:hypothetical protein
MDINPARASVQQFLDLRKAGDLVGLHGGTVMTEPIKLEIFTDYV